MYVLSGRAPVRRQSRGTAKEARVLFPYTFPNCARADREATALLGMHDLQLPMQFGSMEDGPRRVVRGDGVKGVALADVKEKQYVAGTAMTGRVMGQHNYTNWRGFPFTPLSRRKCISFSCARQTGPADT
jgi:hypothetical protein